MNKTSYFPLLIAVALGPLAASAQPVSVGVRGGIHLLGWYKNSPSGATGSVTGASARGVVGPYVSVRLPGNLALQLEGLRRGYGFKRATGGLATFTSHEESGSSWEIPALLVWRPDYQENGWQPYAGVGPALRYVDASTVEIVRRPQILPTDPPARETRTTGHRGVGNMGVMATAGMERKWGPVKFSAELRYAYWTATVLLRDVAPHHNQVSILFGFGSR